MSNPGIIKSHEQVSRVLDYAGLCWGDISPTNIDFYVEFYGCLFVWADAKYKGCPLTNGQKKAFERKCRRTWQPDDPNSPCWSVFFVATHYDEGNEPIPLKNCKVTEYFWNGKWRKTQRHPSLKEAIDLVREAVIAHKFSPKQPVSFNL